jgi:hypothetical protein
LLEGMLRRPMLVLVLVRRKGRVRTVLGPGHCIVSNPSSSESVFFRL